jgi:ubiquinone/menaquinone biosynthesis C-methylase UbiE
VTHKDIKFELKKIIKSLLIGSHYESQSHIDNVYRILRANLKQFIPTNILDVGCGDGQRTIEIANYFNINHNEIHGIDYNYDFIINCKNYFNAVQLNLESEDIPYDDNSFDLVICNQVLEHLKNYQRVINELIRVTRKTGYILIGIPNLAHLINRILLLFGIQPLCIRIDSSHVRGFTHRSFVKMLDAFDDINVIACRGSLIYPLPIAISKYIDDYVLGLTGYICYLLQKI